MEKAKFVLANRRLEGMSLERFCYEWGVVHVALMATSPMAVARIRRYVQGYSLAHRFGELRLAYPLSEDAWDGFASLDYDSLESFLTSLPRRSGGRSHDFSDPKMVVEVTGEDVVIDELRAPEADAVKLVHFLRRAPGVDQETFASTWRTAYAPRLLEAAGGAVGRYVQNPALSLEGSVFEGTAYGQGLFGAYGGVEELFFESADALRRWCADETALGRIREAGEGLVDPAGSFSMVVTDRLRFVSALGPDGESVHCWAPPGIEIRSQLGAFGGAVAP